MKSLKEMFHPTPKAEVKAKSRRSLIQKSLKEMLHATPKGKAKAKPRMGLVQKAERKIKRTMRKVT